MTDDIKARLRKFDKAADHIEALESRIAELEGEAHDAPSGKGAV